MISLLKETGGCFSHRPPLTLGNTLLKRDKEENEKERMGAKGTKENGKFVSAFPVSHFEEENDYLQ